MTKSLFALPALLLALAAPAQAAPALWSVSDDDSTIWLFGSFHLLPPDLEWRTDLFSETLAKADVVYFETDVGPAAQATLGAKSFELGLRDDGKFLAQALPPDVEALLREVSGEYAVPMPLLNTLKPWLASITLTAAVAQRAGLDPNSGVDIVLQREVPAERQAYFETGEEQLALLADGSEQEQTEMLAATLAEVGGMSKMLSKMISAWTRGTPENLAAYFMEDLGTDEAVVMDRLIYDRNERWAETLKGVLAENKSALVVVGAGHMIGDRGVQALLEDAGFEVQRLQ
jgi:uncharacterized protein YbaP (TraB family)